jgi:hypothetical protein
MISQNAFGGWHAMSEANGVSVVLRQSGHAAAAPWRATRKSDDDLLERGVSTTTLSPVR